MHIDGEDPMENKPFEKTLAGKVTFESILFGSKALGREFQWAHGV